VRVAEVIFCCRSGRNDHWYSFAMLWLLVVRLFVSL